MRNKQPEQYYAEFEAEGEESVRHRFNLNRITGLNRLHAEEWLRRREAGRSEASQAEQIALARRSTSAAEEAAEEARKANRHASEANRIAKAALVAAAAAIVLSIIGLAVGAGD